MKLPIGYLPDALEHIDELTDRVSGREVVLFLDFDGTLAAIVDHPDLARLSDSMRETVRRIAKKRRVAIVSGRDREDIEKLVGIEGIVYAGNHGCDIAGAGLGETTFSIGDDHAALMKSLGERLRTELATIPGALVEMKRVSVAVHYRNVADENVAAVERAVREFHAAHPEFRMMSGKKVYEMLPPVEWNKGRAVLWLLEVLKLDRPEVLPIYIGDDITDEDAFEALGGIGIGICVADRANERRPTAAIYRVRGSTGVERLLAGLA